MKSLFFFLSALTLSTSAFASGPQTEWNPPRESDLRPSERVCDCWGWMDDGMHPDFKGRMTVSECIENEGTTIANCD